jgi:hypothetical protein
MFEEIFFPRTAGRYRAAPLVEQRERYLVHLREAGARRSTLRKCANDQLSLVRLVKLKEGSRVRLSQIEAVSAVWSQPKARRCDRSASPKARTRCLSHGIQWLRSLGWLDEPEHEHHAHHGEVAIFEKWLRQERGLSTATIQDYCGAADHFFFWLAEKGTPLDAVQMADIDDAVAAEHRRGAWSRRTIHDYAQRLRPFFLFAEARGWCRAGLAAGIMAPGVHGGRDRAEGPEAQGCPAPAGFCSGGSPDRQAGPRDPHAVCHLRTASRGSRWLAARRSGLGERDHSRSLPEARTNPCLATLTRRRQCHSALHTRSPSDRSRAPPLLHIACAHPTGWQKHPRQDRS